MTNAGTLKKSKGTSTSTVSSFLDNTGNVQVSSGTLALTDGGFGGLDIANDKVVNALGSGDLFRSADRTLIVMRGANSITRYDPLTKQAATSFPGAAVNSLGVSRDGSLVSVGMTAAAQPFHNAVMRYDFPG